MVRIHSLYRFKPPKISQRVTGGTLSSLDRKTRNALSSSEINSGRRSHLRDDDKGFDSSVLPIAWIQGTANGIRFSVTKDGAELADLGTCSISNGQSAVES